MPACREGSTGASSRATATGALLPRPPLQHVALRFALLRWRQLRIMAEGRDLEGAVGRVCEHDPLAAPALAVLLEHLEALRLAGAVVVDEVAEIVAEVEEDAVILRNMGAARALGRAPVRLLPRHQEHVDVAAHREAEPLHVLARRLLLLGGAVRDVEHLDALGLDVFREIDRALDRAGNL